MKTNLENILNIKRKAQNCNVLKDIVKCQIEIHVVAWIKEVSNILVILDLEKIRIDNPNYCGYSFYIHCNELITFLDEEDYEENRKYSPTEIIWDIKYYHILLQDVEETLKHIIDVRNEEFTALQKKIDALS